MNKYLKNLKRVEFVITLDCTGKCKHCSEGDHQCNGIHIDSDYARNIIFDLADKYKLESVMTFGGEPLLYPDSVCEIHTAAKEVGIPHRQLITNGFFSNDITRIKEVSQQIAESGVNDLLLSVDAFHQETIPIDIVKFFAEEIFKSNVKVRTNPAWLIGKEHNNHYNICTREILNEFNKIGVEEAEGNIIFPEGNAVKYLSEYFAGEDEWFNPYKEDPLDVKAISIEPDGSLFGRNIYVDNIIKILDEYGGFDE